MDNPTQKPLGLKLYGALSRAGRPIAEFALSQRLKSGKEDPARVHERKGETETPRPDGELLWIHGASVGESLSVLPLVDRLTAMRPDLNFLITTGTVTSAKLIAERLPERAAHQYVPLDHPSFIDRFLSHWQPDYAVFVESEFWPNLIQSTRKAVKAMAIVNGRISPSSFEDWRRQPNAIRFLLRSFDMIIAQDKPNAERLETLSHKKVELFGNLKYAAPPLETPPAQKSEMLKSVGSRMVWLAASTHEGEEQAVLDAHAILKSEYPDLLTIIAPRHPARGSEIQHLCRELDFSTALRSQNEIITLDTDCYIADTLGELGVFYEVSDVTFVGGSLIKKGGHNPLEPARLNCAILHGPEIFNFADTYGRLRASGGSALVRNERELASAVNRLFTDRITKISMIESAKKTAIEDGKEVLDQTCKHLIEHLLNDCAHADA